MYNVIFIREKYVPYSDDDDGEAKDGIFGIHNVETVQEVESLIKDYCKKHFIEVRLNARDNYGDFGFLVLKDSVVVGDHSMYALNMDFNDYTDSECVESTININSIVRSSELLDSKLYSFVKQFKDSECKTEKALQSLYQSIEKEKQERAKLLELMAKYPDMVDQNGDAG